MKTTLSRSIAVVAGAAVCLLASGLPASAAPGKVSHPAIKYFRASATSLPSAGGTVKLSTAVKGASACVFTSSPRLKGLPAKVSCTRGSATRTIRLPGNSAAGQKAYKFGLTVSGRGGKVAAKPLTVVVREAPPTITQIAVQPSDFPSAGGATLLSAKVSRSTKCTVSATPAVGGLPVTKACVAGSTSAGISIPVTLPALTGTTTRKYDISLKVSGPGGTSVASAYGNVWSQMKFSAPVTIDAPAGWLGTVSCVSSTFCMGMDLAAGSAIRWNGTGWSAPVRIETGPYLDSGYDIHLSCASATFCLAVDTSGNGFVYDGTSWSATAGVGLDAVAVSCASPTFCVALSTTQATIFNGASWSAPATVAATDLLTSVSCPSDSFCMAVSQAGLAYTYTGSGWSAAVNVDAPIEALQVSCASTTLCAAVTSSGGAVLYTGTWSAPATLNASEPADSVSCPVGTSFCMALSGGSYYTSDGTTWTEATSFDPGKPSVLSCASATYCMMTDGSRIFVLDGTSLTSSSAPGGPLHGFTYSVSCATTTFCVAVDWSGAYLVYNGKKWSAPQTINPLASAVDAVSCPSPGFCMAVDASTSNGEGGHIFMFNGRTWTYEGQDALPLSSVSCTGPDFCEMLSYGTDGSVYTATWNGTSVGNGSLDTYLGFGPEPGEGRVSCATQSFCVAVDQLGNAFTYIDGVWSKATALDPGVAASMAGVSCPTTTFCVAIDAGGNEYTYNGSTWTAPTTIDSAGQPQAISCTVTHFCLLGDLSGNVATFNGATWSGTSNVDPVTTAGTGLTGASCADAADCVLVDWEGNALAGTGA
ncbi:MAG TPA: hypothetical protein VK823_10325 [Streptosporangiaceae bacterium]|jgi:hypothetical protein|nr:hypothetical protein [Streptosporangiaceae bacterium]